jgi:hypothetical protein
MSCQTGALTAGGGHFVGCWASRGGSRWSLINGYAPTFCLAASF